MANLLKQALRDEYRDGKTFTFLMPASESIYIPYDFRTVYEQNKRVYCEQKENEMQQKDDFLVVEDAKEKDCKEALDLMSEKQKNVCHLSTKNSEKTIGRKYQSSCVWLWHK